ncbi:hypothetical protein AVEN_196352-1 [Araneus ventricosus]|uniref:Uncharacterized protein n=1 Tax=Araneus ventricosus TaxID=182803 RepID=A0A4Y2AU11_ARAVE|nr:hypothetical protein AVEN_196352-1 [Araneus ventricosus]
MKLFDFKYGRKQETNDEKEENVILLEKTEDEDFGSFQQEMEVAEMKEVISLGPSMDNFTTNLLVLIDNVGGDKMKAHYLYVCGIQKVNGGEYDMRGLRSTNEAKSRKFVSVVNDQFATSESHLKALLPDCIFEVDCRKELFGFQVV